MNNDSSTIVLASSNAGKLKEIRELLEGLDLDIRPQGDFEIPDAIEDGLSFVENAILKARHACAMTGLPAISDDSGIEVDYLDGAPGIYSARYAGGQGNEANNAKLLNALKGIPEEQRTARFQCLMVFMRHANDPTPLICQGTWEGRILFAARGNNGFGYDPVFHVPTHDCSSAELPAETKNSLSHRGQALRQLVAALGKTG